MMGLDSNVLVRYLTQDDPAQARTANALIDGAIDKGERLHLDVVVLCEVMWVLRDAYAFDKATVTAAFEKILGSAHFSIGDRDLLRRALDLFRAGQGDFADYLVGIRNREAGCDATATLDRALKKSELFRLL